MTQDTNGSTILYRVEALERMVQQLVPTKEYDLQSRMQKESSDRIEHNINQLISQVLSLHEKVNEAELKAQQRDADNKQSIADLQLKLLYGLLTIIGSIVVGIAIYYFTNPH